MSMFLNRLANKDDWQCPTNWSVVLLEKNAKRGSGHTPSKKIVEYWNQGVKWVSLSDSYRLDNVYIHDTEKKISHLGIANSSAVLHPPGIVILSRDAGVGKSAITSTEMAVSQHFIVWKCNNKTLNNHFLYYWLQFMKPEFERIAIGSTIKTIGLPYFKKMLILRPPIEEQRKIAEILGAWDKEITLTERLIKAKQKHKKGLMQQLLTGKVRFPGFEGEDEWIEVRFGDVLDIEIGRTPSRKIAEYWDREKTSSNVWLSIADLSQKYVRDSKEYVSDKGVVKANMRLVPVGTVIMSFKLTIGRAAILEVAAYTNEAICSLIPKNSSDIDKHYLFQALNIINFDREVDQAIKGKTLNKSKLKRLRLALPPIREQQKIAAILTACDDEIDLLQRKAAALREQKKGLMQQLLTGKVRVKV